MRQRKHTKRHDRLQEEEGAGPRNGDKMKSRNEK